MYPLTPSIHLPPFLHGLLEHSSVSVLQKNPAGHAHTNVPGWFVHASPLRHGLSKHSSISKVKNRNPARHAHTNVPG